MNNVKFTHRLVALFTLFLFVISTSGVVFFYHFCEHSNKMLYSVYVDETIDQCMEIAKLEYDTSCSQTCCSHHSKQVNSKFGKCSHNKSFVKTVKLDIKFTDSRQNIFPKPAIFQLIILSIFNSNYSQNTDLHSTFCNSSFQPPEQPINKLYGKELLTSHHSLKLDC